MRNIETNQKGFAAVFVILIAAVALVGAGAYFYLTQTSKQKTPPPMQVTINDIVNWQTYHNVEWGIEIQYPSNWNLKGNEMRDPASGAYLAISRLENPKNLSFDEWWKENTIIGGRPTVLASSEDTIINGIKAKIAYMPEENGWHVHIADNQNHIYSLITEGKAADKQTFDKMLSTFKFIEPQTLAQVSTSDIANWQIYRNEKYGFEIKYPKQYKMDGSVIKLSETKIIRVDTDFCCFPIPLPEKQSKITINGVEFEKISGTITKNGAISGVISYRTAQNKQKKEIQIALIEDLGEVLKSDDSQSPVYDILGETEAKILDQMLSTFKLIEPQAVVTKTEILARTTKDLEGQAEKMQLTDGTRCVFAGGATGINAQNERMNYICGDGKLSMVIYGDLTEGDVWTANVSNIERDKAGKGWNVVSTRTVDIAKIWK
jgi:hypothetical protein